MAFSLGRATKDEKKAIAKEALKEAFTNSAGKRAINAYKDGVESGKIKAQWDVEPTSEEPKLQMREELKKFRRKIPSSDVVASSNSLANSSSSETRRAEQSAERKAGAYDSTYTKPSSTSSTKKTLTTSSDTNDIRRSSVSSASQRADQKKAKESK